jgi:acyl-coenzyme A synthetase/AMP-(fatty) acid ligase
MKAPSTDTLKALIRERLRSSRVPERILVIDALPYNEMGKLLRREVRKLFKTAKPKRAGRNCLKCGRGLRARPPA